MNLLQIRSVMILMFSLIIFTGILFPWQALLLFSFFLSINLRKNITFFLPIISLILRTLGWFSYFLIPQKTGSAIFGLVILSQRLLSELWFGTILLKLKRIISSKTRTLTVQCLSRNIWSNQKHFKEKTIKNYVWSPFNYVVGSENYLAFTNSSKANILIIYSN